MTTNSGRHDIATLTTVSVVGLVLVGVGWVMQGGSYVPGLLLQIGSSFFLIVPLVLLNRLLERRLQRAEERTRSISDTLTDMRARLNETATRLDELGTLTRQSMTEQQEEDLQAADAVQERLSRPALIDLSKRAADARAISPGGVRTHVSGATLWVRLRTEAGKEDDGAELSYDLEDRAGARLATVQWGEDETPAAVASRLVTELITRSSGPDQHGYDASALNMQLIEAIRIGLAHRAGTADNQLGPLVELVNDQWAIATDGLYCLSQPYRIPVDRITGTSDDWRLYMAQKPWVDANKFSEAYKTAADLYRHAA